jgi:hypothetical protein
MDTGTKANKTKRRGITWDMEVPLLANRLMWREVFSVLFAFWVAICLFMSLVHVWYTWREVPPGEEVNSLLTVLLFTSAVYWGSFLLTIFVYFLFKGHQKFRFTLDGNQATSVVVRSKTTRFMAGVVTVLAILDDRPGIAAANSMVASEDKTFRRAPWSKLRKVRLHPDQLAISLYRWPWPGTPLVLYLPHQQGFNSAARRIQELCPQLRVG